MTIKAKALQNLYNRGKISKEGLKKAVTDKILTTEDYYTITGESYT